MVVTARPVAGAGIVAAEVSQHFRDLMSQLNRVAYGFDIVTTTTSLTAQLTPGAAYIGGRRVGFDVDSANQQITLVASATNRVFLINDGTFVVNQTGAVPANSIKLYTVVTSATGVATPGTDITDNRDGFTVRLGVDLYAEALVGDSFNGLVVTGGTNTFTLSRGTATLVRAGAHALTLRTTGATDVTFPTSGTLMTTTQVMGVAQGGTGLTAYVTGDILYASGAGTLAARAAVATGNVLISGGVGVAPTWDKVGLTTHVSGILPSANGGTGTAFFAVAGPTVLRTYTFPDASTTVLTTAAAVTAAQGGTGQATYVVGDILFASAAVALSRLAAVAVGSALISGGTGTAPSWGKIALATHVSGILPSANGGTGMAFFAVAGPTIVRTYTFPDADATMLTSAAVVTAAQGGTGQASYVIGDLLFASGITALSRLASVATGSALISTGAGVAPVWGKIALATTVSGTLSAANGGTGQSAYTVGDLLFASGAAALSVRTAVAVGSVLASAGVGTAPVWSSSPSLLTSLAVGTAAAANAAAVLELVSTTKGFLPPRMTTAQRNAIAGPPQGLLLFNTTLNHLEAYAGGWSALTPYHKIVRSYVTPEEASVVDGATVVSGVGNFKWKEILFPDTGNPAALWAIEKRKDGPTENIKVTIWWRGGNVAGDVVWNISADPIVAGEDINATTFLIEVQAAKTAVTGDAYVITKSEITASWGGTSEGDLVRFRLKRESDNVADTFATTARVLAVFIEWI